MRNEKELNQAECWRVGVQGRGVLWAGDNLQAAVMGVIEDVRKREVGPWLMVLSASRALKSRCLLHWGLAREGTPVCVLRLLPWERTCGD